MSDAPTLADLVRLHGAWIYVQRVECGCNKVIPLAPLIQKFGADAPLPSALKRLRCTTCGNNPGTVTLPTPNGSGKARDPIPMRDVPRHLHGWAKIDPRFVPAPLRASA